MIKTLFIKNYIIIDELKIDFSSKFNVLVGETGAGKSVILSAIDNVLGNKVSKELIKTGEKSAYIEIVFSLKDGVNYEYLDQNGIELLDSNELVISREISQSSSRCRVNGQLVTLDFIKELRTFLIDIHSQHQTYTIMNPKYHISLLDNFDKEHHLSLLESYRTTYNEYQTINKELNDLKVLNSNTQNQLDYLKFQVEEIEEAKIEDDNEDEELSEKLNILLNAEKLKENSYNAYEILYQCENSVIDQLSSIKSSISKCLDQDNRLENAYDQLESVYEILRDVSSELRNYSDNISSDEDMINDIHNRIDILNKIKSKYGKSLSQVKENYLKYKSQLEMIEVSEDKIIQLEKKLDLIRAELNDKAKILSSSRQKLSSRLSKLMVLALEKLELPKVQFKIEVSPVDFNENGIDNVEFLISTNVSESLKPLAKVASGGELSRVMLAIKTIFAKADNIDTIVFDEIDSGTSGIASQSIAKAISVLANSHQVICISHQPIIVSCADSMFYVSKIQADVTKVKVEKLSDDKKIEAIALLASGSINQESVNFAKELVGVNGNKNG